MGKIKISKYSIFIVSLFFLDFVICEVYTVGDESGWNSGTGTDFLTWSEKHNFTVGDVLEFKYSKVQHNVKEVTDATYRSCDARDGVIAVYESGKDEITLNESRKYNFICDKDSHCIGGMRFSISVLEASRNNNTAPAQPPATAELPAANSAIAARRKVTLDLEMAVGILILVYYFF